LQVVAKQISVSNQLYLHLHMCGIAFHERLCKDLWPLVTVSGSILQLADDDSTSTLNLEKKRKDKRLW
jgi:hypothetical protein